MGAGDELGWSLYNSDRSTLAVVKRFSRLMSTLDRETVDLFP